MMWSSAKAWGYVSHDPFEGLVLPKIARQAPSWSCDVNTIKIFMFHLPVVRGDESSCSHHTTRMGAGQLDDSISILSDDWSEAR